MPHPYAVVELAKTDLRPIDRAFLTEWARRLKIPLDELLKRILIAGVMGQLYVEKIPDRDSLTRKPSNA